MKATLGSVVWLGPQQLEVRHANGLDRWLVSLDDGAVAFLTARAARGDPHGLYDLGMLSFQGSLGCFSTAYLAFALGILFDKNEIFPKWLAYVSIWQIVTEVIATQMWVFRSGPFAWNGSIAFWLAVIVFGFWLNCQGLLLKKATDRQPAGSRPPD